MLRGIKLLFKLQELAVLKKHILSSIFYLFSINIFRLSNNIKYNYEFNALALSKASHGLNFMLLERSSQIYRYSTAQFCEQSIVKSIYNLKILHQESREYLKLETRKTLFVCILYLIFTSSCFTALLFILMHFGIILPSEFKYYCAIIYSKNVISLISAIRTVNDYLSVIPVNLIINYVQLGLITILYGLVMPMLNIKLTLKLYTIINTMLSISVFIAYYCSLCIFFRSVILPKIFMPSLSYLRNIHYLIFALIENTVNYFFVDIFLAISGIKLAEDQKIRTIYIINNTAHHFTAIMSNPIETVSKIYINKYQQLSTFLNNSYILFLFYLVVIGTPMSLAYHYGILDKIFLIKLDNKIQYIMCIITSAMLMYTRLWEITIMTNKQDYYPSFVLILAYIIYFISSIQIYNYGFDIITALLLGKIMSVLLRYLLSIIRSIYTMRLNVTAIMLDLIKMGSLIGCALLLTIIS